MAEEAVQDTFVRLLSGKVRFQDRGPGSFRCWFLSLVTNSARMARRTERRQERKRNLSAREYALRKGCETGAEPAPGRSEWAAALGHALDGLEERSRTPVVLRFMEGMQQREMAALLGVSQQMVARRIDQGVAQLRLRLAGYGV